MYEHPPAEILFTQYANVIPNAFNVNVITLTSKHLRVLNFANANRTNSSSEFEALMTDVLND